MTTGGLGLIFGKSDAVPAEEFNVKCIEKKTCLFSKRVDMNSATIYTAFMPGDYAVALFYKGMTDDEREMLNSVYSRVPYSIHVKIDPLFHSEDRFNCEAGHIPHSLNMPGLMDGRGFLRYSDRVIADFKTQVQSTAFSIDHKSWLRVVTVEPSGLNIDIRLLKGSKELTRSNVLGESEGIMIELEKGQYELSFSVENSILSDPRHKFCEIFVLEIGISPSSAVTALSSSYDLDTCKQSSALDELFDSIENTLETDGKVVSNVDPSGYFRLPVNKRSEGELEIYSQEFRIPSHAYAYFGKS